MLKVLIADDEVWVSSLIRNSIEWPMLDMEVIGEANDGVDALQNILEQKPDIVISDVRMPGLNGIEVVEKTRKAGIEAHFIIISGYQDFEYVQGALKNNVSDYILKPYDEDVLMAALQKVRTKILEQRHQTVEYDKIKQQLHESVEKLRSRILLELLLGRQETPPTLLELNTNYDCGLQEGLFLVLWLKYSPCSKEEGGLPFFALACMEEEVKLVLSKFCNQILCVQTQDGMAAILNFSSENMQALQLGCELAVTSMLSKIGLRYAQRCSVGMGEVCKSPEQLARSAKVARDGADCHIHFGFGTLYDINKIDVQTPSLSTIFSWESQQQFSALLESFSIEEVPSFIASLFEKMQGAIVHPGTVSAFLDAVVDYFHRFLGTLELPEETRLPLPGIEACETMEQVKQQITEYICDMLKMHRSASAAKSSKPVQMAKNYITIHYGEKITLQDIAEHVFLSPQYFSELFKLETGSNFSDYLAEYRIDVSKDLLRDARYKIKDINYMVGYKDSKSFTKLFKKVVGISPTEYRKLYG